MDAVLGDLKGRVEGIDGVRGSHPGGSVPQVAGMRPSPQLAAAAMEVCRGA